MDEVFNKSFSELDESERKMWEAAYEVLQRGDRLFGLSPEDFSHVSWALGFVLHSLKVSEEAPAVYMIIEIGKEIETGYSVRVIRPEDV